MTPRLDAYTLAPTAIANLLRIEEYIAAGHIERELVHLVKLRASQINGCAYCLEMHIREALADGESALRLGLLSAWRESSAFSDRERAALTWTESITSIATQRAGDADFAVLSAIFSPEDIIDLTVIITQINTWNRIAVGFRYAHPSVEL